MNPTAELADIVLPVASRLRARGAKDRLRDQRGGAIAGATAPGRGAAAGEARSDTEISSISRCGSGSASTSGTATSTPPIATNSGLTAIALEALRASARRHPVAAGDPLIGSTPSRQNGIAGVSRRRHARWSYIPRLSSSNGYPPLPDFEEPPIGPVARADLVARYPLVLTSAKHTLFCQSQHRGLPSLRKRAPDPEVELHPEAARARGIGNGDWVSIETPEGGVRARARLNENLDPRVVVGQHGWWQSCAELGATGYDPFGPNGANYNLLIGGKEVDPVSGTASHRSYLCDIRRAVDG